MKLREGLVAARSHLTFVVVLLILFGVLQQLDREEGIASLPSELREEIIN